MYEKIVELFERLMMRSIWCPCPRRMGMGALSKNGAETDKALSTECAEEGRSDSEREEDALRLGERQEVALRKS